MTTAAIRQKLMNFIADADDKKIKGLYMLMEDDINESMVEEYSPEFKKELEKRVADYRSGKSKMVTPEELKKRTQKLMKQRKKR
jgi:putative addiction module component (TIGR02574 family)